MNSSGYTLRLCNHCQTQYKADNRNLKRGWGLTCSKSCAASLREKSKPGYSPKRVEKNNVRRALWNSELGKKDENEYGVFRGRLTSEGYKMYEWGDGKDTFTAVDEFGDAVYNGHTWEDDTGDSEYWGGKDW